MYPDNIRSLVNKKRQMNQTYERIARDLCLTKSAIYSMVNVKRKSQKKKSGPKSKINCKTTLQMKRFIEYQNSMGCKVTCNAIIHDLNLEITRKTVNNWFLKQDYLYTKCVQKIQLTKDHKLNRVEKVSKWIEENIQWESAVFTDEKVFSLDGPDNW